MQIVMRVIMDFMQINKYQTALWNALRNLNFLLLLKSLKIVNINVFRDIKKVNVYSSIFICKLIMYQSLYQHLPCVWNI